MRFLVTGASGFLGGRVASRLAENGEQVRILARASNDLSHLEGARYERATGSLDDESSLREAFREVSHVIHCAGCSTDWAPWERFHEANVAGVARLLRAASECPSLQRLVHVSTTDVYGYPRVAGDESTPIDDVGLPYNKSKIIGEQLVRASGLPVTVMRPATIYGPRGQAFVVEIAARLRGGEMAVFDGGRARGGFCYVDNAAECLIEAARHPRAVGEVLHVADGVGVTWREYVDRMADGLGVQRAWLNVPSGAGLMLGAGLEAWQRLVGGKQAPLLTRHAVYLLSRDQEFDNKKTRRLLGWSPRVDFDEGMRRSVRWLRRD